MLIKSIDKQVKYTELYQSCGKKKLTIYKLSVWKLLEQCFFD